MPALLRLEGTDLETLLARVRDEHGPAARIVQADRVRSGGIAGFFAREHYEVAVEVGTPGGTEQPPRPDADEPAPPLDQDPAPTSLLELADQVERVERQAHAPTVSTQSPSFAEVLAQLTRDNAAGGSRDASGPGAPETPVFAPAPFVPPEAVDVRHRLPASAADRLLALGLPRGLLPDDVLLDHPVDLYSALVATLRARLPQPPRFDLRDGEILVVLGSVARALEVARSIATAARLDPDTAVLAAAPTAVTGLPAAKRITGPADAARRARKLRGADGGHVVAVDAPLDPDGARWAASVAAALGARSAWACVEATSKPGDVIDWIDRLDCVEALAIEGCAATRDPASALALYVPVALLDRQRATPEAWAGLLCARMTRDGD